MPNNVYRAPASSERTKASKIRAKIKLGQTLESDEAAWFADYESAREATAARGASQSKKISYTEEEHQAVGEGESAAVAAAAGAAMVTAEGNRLDSVISLAMASMKEANELLLTMTRQMMKRTEGFEETLIKMMQSQVKLVDQHRENAIRATDAEIRAIEAEANQGGEKDEISDMIKEILPAMMAQISARQQK